MVRANGADDRPILVGHNLARVYEGRRVIGVDKIEIRGGEVLTLLGPNGAGKSTLMRLLAGLEPPDAGELWLRGERVARDDRRLRRAVSAVLQRPYLWRGTVAQNVEYGLRVRRVPSAERRARVRGALETLGILELEDVSVDRLSGGEAQRVALARGLVVEPEVLFLDEPTADLDVAVRRDLLFDLERIVHHSAPAVVLITHDPGEAFALADRVIVLEEGKVAQSGTPADIYESPSTEFVASFTGAEFTLSGDVVSAGDGTLTVRLASGLRLEAAGHGTPGSAVRVAYRPEDVVISPEQAAVTSARNRFHMSIARLHPQGGLVRLRLEGGGLRLEAVITRHAQQELELTEGSAVLAQIKATALLVFPA